MKIRLIRNATQIITYNNKRFLVDPFLAAKGTHDPLPFTPNQHLRNPLVDLPISIDEILKDIDAVIVTHIHPDHFDDVAKEVLPKDIKMFVQNEEEFKEIQEAGFKDIEILSENGTMFDDVKLTKTKAKHAIDDETLERYTTILHINSKASGVIFTNKNEKTLYLTGDTVWYDEVEKVLNTYKPEVIVANASDGQYADGKSMIMGKEDIVKIHNICPNSTIIASHLETLNPTVVTRKELRELVAEKGISANVLIPEDGEEYNL